MTSNTTSPSNGATSAVPKVAMLTLAAMVVGSMVGGGVFTLPRNFAEASGVVGAVIAWLLAGLGMLMLALVFQSLAVRRPDLDSGIYVYAQTGFGPYAGFNAAWGYWASNVVGNVFYLVFAAAAIGEFVPGMGEGDTVLAVLLGSVLVWVFHALIARGIRQATTINRIVTVAKLLPILMFVVVTGLAFDGDVFRANLWGSSDGSVGSLAGQVRDTMLVTTFVFLGVEGASVFSRLARRRRDVGRATVLGFVSVLALFSLVTLTSYGVMPQADLAQARQPSMGAVLGEVVGPWGETFVGVGVIISVLGAYLAWALLNAEVMFMPARSGVMPKALGRESRNGTPITALLTTSISIQVFLVLVLVVDDALEFMLELDTALTLVPYLLVAAYALKLTLTRETYDATPSGTRRRDQLVAVLAVVYSLVLLYAAGLEYVLLGCLIYAPGTILYVRARRERGLRTFSPAETGVCVAIWVVAAVAIVLLATGTLTF